MSKAPASPILQVLQEMHRKFAAVHEGDVATYIPELAKADPTLFGICVVTADGHVYEVGDTGHAFTIQSISKPFVYGLALEDKGIPAVAAKVGIEPTGDAFNSISLEANTGRPRNPMINAGAIATTGLVSGATPEERRDRVVDMLSRYAGRPLPMDKVVHQCESETGHRNRAIGHMLRNFDILTEDPTPTVDVYFQQCSVSITCRDLGIMAATLANHGVNPITGIRALQGPYVEHVLSVMGTCGMYNWAGEWLYRIGIPAKSGVAGGVLAVLPGQIGIGVFSPRLDAQGNSVRGIKVCEALSRYFDLHIFNQRNPGPALRSSFTGAQMSSRRVRPLTEKRHLTAHSAEIGIFQLQGGLGFATVEHVIRSAVASVDSFRHLLIDLRRVQTINESAAHLLHDLIVTYAQHGKKVLFCNNQPQGRLAQVIEARLGPDRVSLFKVFADFDLALEWCEDQLIAHYATGITTPSFVSPEANELLHGLTSPQRERLLSVVEHREYPLGAAIITVGECARSVFLLERGQASVVFKLPDGSTKRLATFCSGMVFGELALLDDSPRSASVMADTPVTCAVLEVEALDQIGLEEPAIKFQVLKNLAVALSDKLRSANRALSALE